MPQASVRADRGDRCTYCSGKENRSYNSVRSRAYPLLGAMRNRIAPIHRLSPPVPLHHSLTRFPYNPARRSMADLEQLRNTVERASSKRLGDHLEHLRREIAEDVIREIAPLLSSSGNGASPSAQREASSEVLRAAVASIHDAHSQADILKALLEGAAKFSARVALFVVRGNTLAGWQARGLADENIRGTSIDGSKGLSSRAIQDRSRHSGSIAEFDETFAQQQGAPHDNACTIFPLVVKDKVAAVLYVDSGSKASSPADYAAVEVLTRFACLWLEHEAGKRQAAPGGEGSAEASATATSVSAMPAAPATTSTATAEPSLGNVPADDQEIHKKAQRFAKLLVDEIKLYNQAKVAEGKQNRAIYKLLREDIEKSRATYEKRYGATPAASGKYFDSEVIRILADNDRSLLGSDFTG